MIACEVDAWGVVLARGGWSARGGAFEGGLAEPVVGQDHQHGSLDDGRRPWQHARVVSTLGLQRHCLAGTGDDAAKMEAMVEGVNQACPI